MPENVVLTCINHKKTDSFSHCNQQKKSMFIGMEVYRKQESSIYFLSWNSLYLPQKEHRRFLFLCLSFQDYSKRSSKKVPIS